MLMKKTDNNRRKFIQDIGAGAFSVLTIPKIVQSQSEYAASSWPDDASAEPVEFGNGVNIELLTKGKNFLGIGAVAVKGISLRDGTVPLFCEIRTPDGVQISEYPILHKSVLADRIEIVMNAVTRQNPVMEYMLHSVRNRENLYGWVEEEKQREDTVITLTLLPVSRKIGNELYQGFSYRYRFETQSMPVFKILDHGSWELGGKAMGNENWMRVGHVPSIVQFTNLNERYSTENYYAGIANPNAFQFLPLQTELQGFTFQTGNRGILITWPTEVQHIRTLIEKPAGMDRIFHFHQHCNDLSNSITTSPVEVLFLNKAGSSRVDNYNVFEQVRSYVETHLLEQTGIKPERASTYGMIEQWDEPDFDFYTDTILPAFAEKGIHRIFLPNEFQNAMNTWGLSNMCCNVDFKFSETVGPEKIRRFCKKADASGIRVDMWGNTAISTLTEMFEWNDGREKGIKFLPKKDSIVEVLQKSKDPFVRNPSNAIEGDHYTPRFAVLNLRDPDIRAYWMKQWKIAYDSGINGIFLDSSFNMSSDKFHYIQNTERTGHDAVKDYYRPEKQPPAAILTQYHAHLEWVKEMQGMGISYCGEDLGVFGVHRHGPDLDMFIDCMPLFPESFMDFNEQLARNAGKDPLMIYFMGLAYRIIWMIKWNFQTKSIDPGIQDDRIYFFLRAFNQVNESMVNRFILPGEEGVKYSEGSRQVYWIFKPMELNFERNMNVNRLNDGKRFHSKQIKVEPYDILVVEEK
jgi:hypothetical protein